MSHDGPNELLSTRPLTSGCDVVSDVTPALDGDGCIVIVCPDKQALTRITQEGDWQFTPCLQRAPSAVHVTEGGTLIIGYRDGAIGMYRAPHTD